MFRVFRIMFVLLINDVLMCVFTQPEVNMRKGMARDPWLMAGMRGKHKYIPNCNTNAWAKQNKAYYFRARRNYTIRVRFE